MQQPKINSELVNNEWAPSVSADRNILYRGTSLLSAALALAVQSVHVALNTPSCSVGPTEAVWNTSAVPVYDIYMHHTVYDGWPVFHNTYDVFCFHRNTIEPQETKPISFYCHPSPCKYQITGWIVSKCLIFKIAVWCWESTSWGPKFDSQEQGREPYCLVLSSGRVSYEKEIQ